MAVVQEVVVIVGDWLRLLSNGWEGQVLSMDDPPDTVVLRMNSGTLQLEPVANLTYNWWDPKISPTNPF